MPAYCANERLGYKNDYVSWSHLLVGQLLGKKNSENGKKKTACTAWGTFAVFAMLSSFPGPPTKSFLKSILHSNENDNVMKFQFRFAWNARSSPAFGQRTSVDQLAELSAAPMTGFFSWRGLIQQRALELSSQLQRWDAAKRRFSFRFQKALPVYWEIAHAEKHKWTFLSDLRFFML